MSNIATRSGNNVLVNGITVFNAGDTARATTIVNRLTHIFDSSDKDLDFITPSYANGQYVVCCPRVRRPNDRTYFYDTTPNAPNNYHPSKLYEDSNWVDATISPAQQTAILTITSSPTNTPWQDALTAANAIRAAINLNFNDAAGRANCRQLQLAAPRPSGYIYPVISTSARLDYYGNVCQGTSPGTVSTCTCGAGFVPTAQNISGVTTANMDVFHPQDLTAAMTSTNSWNTAYRNRFVKVTNLANTSLSIVVRVTDTAPPNTGIELSDRAYRAIGAPGAGNNKLRIEEIPIV